MHYAITYESGINDSLASPMVMLAMALWLNLTQGAPLESMHWLLMTVGYENVLCAALSYALGLLDGWMSQSTLLPLSPAFTLLLLFGLHMAGMNAIIGVFIGNLGLPHTVTENEDLQQEEMQSTLERLFTIPVFFLLGIVLPWQDWLALLAAVLIVFLRRCWGHSRASEPPPAGMDRPTGLGRFFMRWKYAKRAISTWPGRSSGWSWWPRR